MDKCIEKRIFGFVDYSIMDKSWKSDVLELAEEMKEAGIPDGWIVNHFTPVVDAMTIDIDEFIDEFMPSNERVCKSGE